MDKSANANGQRCALSPAAVDLSPVAPIGLPALMTQLLADYAATGLPSAYLPVNEPGMGGGDIDVGTNAQEVRA